MFSDIDFMNIDSSSYYEAAADGNPTLVFMPPNNNYRYYSNRG